MVLGLWALSFPYLRSNEDSYWDNSESFIGNATLNKNRVESREVLWIRKGQTTPNQKSIGIVQV